jgi:hypothetical protein
LNKMHFGLAGLLHFVRNDGILESRHCNKASAASAARLRWSRRGNPGVPVIARRRSRRGNPDDLNKCIFFLLDCFTSFAMTASWIGSLRSQ